MLLVDEVGSGVWAGMLFEVVVESEVCSGMLNGVVVEVESEVCAGMLIGVVVESGV